MSQPKPNIDKIVQAVLASIEREREREIIGRRFGLSDRRETLEQIGELLGITRERVRQLEKAVLGRLKAFADGGRLTGLSDFESFVLSALKDSGDAARLVEVSNWLTKTDDKVGQARVAFLASLSPSLLLVDDDDDFYQSITVAKNLNRKKLNEMSDKIIKSVTDIGEPTAIENIAKSASLADALKVKAVASISKKLAQLNNTWGLTSWPIVNPRNIRDKIYVILSQEKRHLHFNEIASAIKSSGFKRNDVTTQAIHNELIKDRRFVLIGRGIYALKEWGFEPGTVADIITKVLKKEGKPLHRDDIVKKVLKSRFVKETTILLNLQGKPQFKRVAKATYALAEI